MVKQNMKKHNDSVYAVNMGSFNRRKLNSTINKYGATFLFICISVELDNIKILYNIEI